MKLRRPSPALLIACLALFISLGGVSYGVATGFIDSREIKNNTVRTQDLRNNDVRSLDIRNNAVTGRDVKTGTLTSSDINETKLTNVNATKLDGVGLGGLLRIDTTGFTNLTLGAAFSTVTGETAPGFDVDPLGYVHLRGLLQRDLNTSDTAFTLPVGVRPVDDSRFILAGTDSGEQFHVEIQADGDAVVNGLISDEIGFDGVTFKAGG